MMCIGECARCAKEIVAPNDVVVWADNQSFHRECYDAQLARDIAEQVSLRQGGQLAPAGPAVASGSPAA